MEFQLIPTSQENPQMAPVGKPSSLASITSQMMNGGSVRKKTFGENKSARNVLSCTPNSNRLKLGNVSNTPLTGGLRKWPDAGSLKKPTLESNVGSLKKKILENDAGIKTSGGGGGGGLPTVYEDVENSYPLTRLELAEQNHPSEILEFLLQPEQIRKFLEAPAETDEENEDDAIYEDDDEYFCGLL